MLELAAHVRGCDQFNRLMLLKRFEWKFLSDFRRYENVAGIRNLDAHVAGRSFALVPYLQPNFATTKLDERRAEVSTSGVRRLLLTLSEQHGV